MDEQGSAALQGAASGAATGAAFGPWGAAIGGVIGGAAGYFGTPKRPKYTINPENEENKALGLQAAFGTNPSISRGISTLDQNAAEDLNAGQQYTANTGSILNLLRSINTTRKQGTVGLLGEGAQIQSQGRSQLMNANSASIDEKDKAWNYNNNMPYQNQVASNRDFAKGTTENLWRYLDAAKAQKLYQGQTDTPTYTAQGTTIE